MQARGKKDRIFKFTPHKYVKDQENKRKGRRTEKREDTVQNNHKSVDRNLERGLSPSSGNIPVHRKTNVPFLKELQHKKLDRYDFKKSP